MIVTLTELLLLSGPWAPAKEFGKLLPQGSKELCYTVKFGIEYDIDRWPVSLIPGTTTDVFNF